MKIEMSAKYQPREYASQGYMIELTPDDLGLDSPVSEEEFDAVLKKLEYHAAKALHLWLLREGFEDKDRVISIVKKYR